MESSSQTTMRASSQNRTLVIMAKAPKPGMVKTRLSPHLAPSVLGRAFEILATHDVVVGPTHDGGYYLVGAKLAHPSLFDGDGMGTRSACDGLLTRTKLLGLSTGFTEPFYDIDVADD